MQKNLCEWSGLLAFPVLGLIVACLILVSLGFLAARYYYKSKERERDRLTYRK